MERFYFTIDGSDEQYEATECSLECVEDVLIDKDVQDFIADLCSKNPALEKVVGDKFDIDDLNKVKVYIDKEYSDKLVRIFNKDGEEEVSYPLNVLYNALVDWYLSDEHGEIEACCLWSEQLQNFIDKGMWQFAMKADNGTIIKDPKEWPLPRKNEEEKTIWIKEGVEYNPLMWFGIVDGPILSKWTMNVESNGMDAIIPKERGMGDYGGQMRIRGFEVNYNCLFDGMTSWYFGACGDEGANFSKVIGTCPIDFEKAYRDDGTLVSTYCEILKLQSL